MRLHIGLPGPLSVSVGGRRRRRSPAQRQARRRVKSANRAKFNQQLDTMPTGAVVLLFGFFALIGVLMTITAGPAGGGFILFAVIKFALVMKRRHRLRGATVADIPAPPPATGQAAVSDRR